MRFYLESFDLLIILVVAAVVQGLIRWARPLRGASTSTCASQNENVVLGWKTLRVSFRFPLCHAERRETPLKGKKQQVQLFSWVSF